MAIRYALFEKNITADPNGDMAMARIGGSAHRARESWWAGIMLDPPGSAARGIRNRHGPGPRRRMSAGRTPPACWNRLESSGWHEACGPERWAAVLQQREDVSEVSVLWHNAHRGRPLTIDAFLSKLEFYLGRCLRSLLVGRPNKEKPAPLRSQESLTARWSLEENT